MSWNWTSKPYNRKDQKVVVKLCKPQFTSGCARIRALNSRSCPTTDLLRMCTNLICCCVARVLLLMESGMMSLLVIWWCSVSMTGLVCANYSFKWWNEWETTEGWYLATSSNTLQVGTFCNCRSRVFGDGPVLWTDVDCCRHWYAGRDDVVVQHRHKSVVFVAFFSPVRIFMLEIRGTIMVSLRNAKLPECLVTNDTGISLSDSILCLGSWFGGFYGVCVIRLRPYSPSCSLYGHYRLA